MPSTSTWPDAQSANESVVNIAPIAITHTNRQDFKNLVTVPISPSFTVFVIQTNKNRPGNKGGQGGSQITSDDSVVFGFLRLFYNARPPDHQRV